MNGKLASLIALAPMLFHSLFGCCWHHAHVFQEQAVAVTSSDASSHVDDHARHHDCGHAHDVFIETAHNGLESAEHSSTCPPCEDEGRCGVSEMVATVVSPVVYMEAWNAIPGVLADIHALQRCQLSAGSDLLERSHSTSAREHCALTQVWLV